MNDLITIRLDPGYVFDILAILFVKAVKSGVKQPEMRELVSNIISQIGKKKYKKIMNSELFEKLVQANSCVYDLVEKLRVSGGSPDAVAIDNANIARYELKKQIQKIFFNSDLREQKYFKK